MICNGGPLFIVMQAGDASGTGLFDTANRKFDEERMRTIDQSLPEFFPELIGPNEVRMQRPTLSECPLLLSRKVWQSCSMQRTPKQLMNLQVCSR